MISMTVSVNGRPRCWELLVAVVLVRGQRRAGHLIIRILLPKHGLLCSVTVVLICGRRRVGHFSSSQSEALDFKSLALDFKRLALDFKSLALVFKSLLFHHHPEFLQLLGSGIVVLCCGGKMECNIEKV
jgi:hypothetical protein